ncbi:hypothetical protein JG687_00019617 [Phytophthora cactorum]|uniref:Uncharacterized protein n=1 Tax=Phytophthora cactorum TaxID=29920 RepID=A0A8T1TJI1_9STRA|nr:hypothetical protein GQ600_2795 [Phytophthora cactorum]KAG6941493.1 hypothetical protein JG687_00019617 [Phytophthora cactorum]
MTGLWLFILSDSESPSAILFKRIITLTHSYVADYQLQRILQQIVAQSPSEVWWSGQYRQLGHMKAIKGARPTVDSVPTHKNLPVSTKGSHTSSALTFCRTTYCSTPATYLGRSADHQIDNQLARLLRCNSRRHYSTFTEIISLLFEQLRARIKGRAVKTVDGWSLQPVIMED